MRTAVTKPMNKIDLPAVPKSQVGKLIAEIFGIADQQNELRRDIDEIVAEIEGIN
jgi:hypothetical protein